MLSLKSLLKMEDMKTKSFGQKKVSYICIIISIYVNNLHIPPCDSMYVTVLVVLYKLVYYLINYVGWRWAQFRQVKHPVFWVCHRNCKSNCGADLATYSHCTLPTSAGLNGQTVYK